MKRAICIWVTVTNFIQHNIICRFGIRKNLLYDNVTPFINIQVQRFFYDFGIDHVKSSSIILKEKIRQKPLVRPASCPQMVYEEPQNMG